MTIRRYKNNLYAEFVDELMSYYYYDKIKSQVSDKFQLIGMMECTPKNKEKRQMEESPQVPKETPGVPTPNWFLTLYHETNLKWL